MKEGAGSVGGNKDDFYELGKKIHFMGCESPGFFNGRG
jgi:hypothetical protein